MIDNRINTVREEQTKKEIEALPEEDKIALFYNMYGHKLHTYLCNMSVKQIRRALMHSLGNMDPKYEPKTQEERFVKWACDKLIELKMSLQIFKFQESLKDAEEEFKKNENLEDKLIEHEVSTLQAKNENLKIETLNEGNTSEGEKENGKEA